MHDFDDQDDFDEPTTIEQRPIISAEMRDHAKLLEALDNLDDTPCMVWPDAYFPEHGDNGFTVNWAKQQCQACPLLELCADYGLKHQPYHGIWGGLTVMDRKRINKLQGITWE